MLRVARLGLRPRLRPLGPSERSSDQHLARLAVQLEEHRPRAVGVRLADGQELDDQRLARLDVDARSPRPAPCRRRTPASAARSCREYFALVRDEVGEDLAGTAGTRRRPGRSAARPSLLSSSAAAASKSAGGSVSPGPAGERLAAAQDLASAAACGKPPGGWPSLPSKNSITDSGNASSRVAFEHVARRQVVGDHEQRHVADDLRRRRDLDDVAEQLVDLGVHPADLVPAVAEAQRLGLLVAGSCTARRASRGGRRRPCRRRQAALERRVELADRLPVVGELVAARRGRARCRASVKRSASTSAFRFGWTGAARTWRPSRASTMSTPCLGRLERCDAGLHAGGVVRVEVDRHADLLLAASCTSSSAAYGLQQAGHVLDGQDVRAELLQLLGQIDVVLQVVLGRASGSRMSPV